MLWLSQLNIKPIFWCVPLQTKTILFAQEIEKNRILRETLAAFVDDAYEPSSLKSEEQQDISADGTLNEEKVRQVIN